MSDSIKYIKVWFESKANGKTAGIILKDNDKRLNPPNIRELSKMFPYSEASRMEMMGISCPFESFEMAFNWEHSIKGLTEE